MPYPVLITGGAGFVGSHLADELLRRGHRVRVFDNLDEQVHHGKRPGHLSPAVEFIKGDMRDLEAVRNAVRGMEVIFHLASAVGVGQSMYEISRYVASNTWGTANLLQSLLQRKSLERKSNVRRLVVASSMSVYGEGRYLCAVCGDPAPQPRGLPQLRKKQWEAECPQCAARMMPIATSESKPLQCASIYALSKRDQEEMCLLFGRTYGVPVVALRYFNIYGTRQALSNPYTGVAAIFAARLLNRRPPLIFEDGLQLRDFVSVHDVVRATALAMESPHAPGQVFNIGAGEPIAIREVADALARSLGSDVKPEITGRYRVGDVRHCFADISAAREKLGFVPQVDFEQGMQELAEWLRAESMERRNAQTEDQSAHAWDELDRFGLTV